MKDTTAWLINSAMQDVVTSGTGTAARLSSGMVVAGKTGTTSSNYDYWFCGSTPYYTASIWMGYDSNTNFSNSNLHKVIWRKIMDKIVEAEEQDTSATFEKPANIVTEKICAESGLLPSPDLCKTIITEYFAKDTVPTKTCDVHQNITLCDDTHYKATKHCPHTTTYHYTVNDSGDIYLDDADFIPPDDFMNTPCPEHDKKKKHKDKSSEEDDTETQIYQIGRNVDGDGYISGPETANAGDTVTLSFIANPGSILTNVVVDGVAQGAISEYTFENIKNDHFVIAIFVPEENIDAEPVPTGSARKDFSLRHLWLEYKRSYIGKYKSS